MSRITRTPAVLPRGVPDPWAGGFLRPLLLVDHGDDVPALVRRAAELSRRSASYEIVHVWRPVLATAAWTGLTCIVAPPDDDLELAGATLLHDARLQVPSGAGVRTTLMRDAHDIPERLDEIVDTRASDVIVAAPRASPAWWPRSNAERWLRKRARAPVVRLEPRGG